MSGRKLLEDNDGNMSTMRLIAVWGAGVGSALCVSGIIAMFLGLEGAPVAMGTGAGLFSIGELAKALQAQKGL